MYTKKRIKAFTLIEILVVMATLAAISAFSVPLYTDFIIKAKVKTLWQEGSLAKQYVENQYVRYDTDPTTININADSSSATTSSSSNVECIQIENGKVSVVGLSSNLGNNDIWISFEPIVNNGQFQWSCFYSNDAQKYTNEVCTTFQEKCNAISDVNGNIWGNSIQVGATEYFVYNSTLNTPSEVSTAFQTECTSDPNTFDSCGNCNSFSNTSTEQRSVDFNIIASIGGGSQTLVSQQCSKQLAIPCVDPNVPTC